jgi:hypothetical protein
MPCPARTTVRHTLMVLAALALVAVSGSAALGAKVVELEVDSVTLSTDRVVGGESLTGTVTLNQPAPVDTQVVVVTSAGSPAAEVPESPVTILAGETTAAFTVVTAESPGTRRVFVEALLADGSSDVVPSAELIIVPTAQTDLIEITKATMSKSGTLTVTAVSENPDAVLTAEFNGQPVPGESRDGRFRGQLELSQATSGIVVVTSQFGGCAQRNPLGPSGSQFC